MSPSYQKEAKLWQWMHAVSYIVYKDICAALAEAPNQLPGGNSFFCQATDSNT